MEETQAIDFNDLLLAEEEEPVQVAFPQVLLDCAACVIALLIVHVGSL